MGKELSIYVHIPFCQRKCLYCDFLSFKPGQDQVDDYFRALGKELKALSGECREYQVSSVFFGGGTPSFPKAELVCGILDDIGDSFVLSSDAEISLEVNPASAIKDKLLAYRRAGFNRISIGAQSVNDDELRTLGRLHDSHMFYETYDNARDAGFDNINVDLMSALPGQKTESYLRSLERIVALRPEHISAYSLIVEEGTPFFDMDLDLPSEDEDRLMYHETKRILAENGYHRYEISNYASSSEYECRHNKVYWKRGNYLGLGLGAASMVNNVRWSNIRDIDEYVRIASGSGVRHIDGADLGECGRIERPDIRKLRENVQELTVEEQMEEFMFLGLRLVEGVSISGFSQIFDRDIYEIYGDAIGRYVQSGHLIVDGDRLRLSDNGLDVSNTVMAEFLL